MLYDNYDKEFMHISDEPKVEKVKKKAVPTTVKTPAPKKTSLLKIIFISMCVCGIFIFSIMGYVYYVFHVSAQPDIYPIVFDIPKGSSLQNVTDRLDQAGIITSPFLFRSSMIISGLESSIKTGQYTFSKPIIMTEVIDRLVKGKYEYVPVRLIIREGEDARSVALAVYAQFPKLATTTIFAELKKREGTLFPETYLFAPFATLSEILDAIDIQYEKRIEKYRPMIASSTRTEMEIITIASILEKEVPKKEDMHTVAGIIYNRLKIGMPLQMDSTLGYLTGKASLDLTLDDLKLDSSYNSYINKGLPPTPIGNPGDASIDAALHPSTHSYIFFLSDATGINHYAKTYKEHLANRKKYLGK